MEDFIRDDRIAAIARGDDAATAKEISDIAHELLRARRLSRGDSRRAMQVRRLRWSVELVLLKVEHMAEAATGEHLVTVTDKLVGRVEELHRDVRALPLELEGVSVPGVIARWLRSDACGNNIGTREWSSVPDELADAIERGDWKDALHG